VTGDSVVLKSFRDDDIGISKRNTMTRIHELYSLESSYKVNRNLSDTPAWIFLCPNAHYTLSGYFTV